MSPTKKLNVISDYILLRMDDITNEILHDAELDTHDKYKFYGEFSALTNVFKMIIDIDEEEE